MEVKWIKYGDQPDRLAKSPEKDIVLLFGNGEIRRWNEEWPKDEVTHFLILPPSVPA